MVMGKQFTVRDFEHRFALSEETGKWQHLAGTRWSLFSDESGAYTACLRIAEDEMDEEYTWASRGISCSIGTAFSIDEGRHLIIRCDSASFHAPFRDTVLTLVNKECSEASDVINELEISVLFFSIVATLSEERAMGLFGELFFLSRHLGGPISDRIQSWDGPDYSLSDFNWNDPGFHVEVKSSGSQNPPLTHIISSTNQLHSDEQRRLALFSMSSRRDSGGDISLSDLVNEIEAEIAKSGNPADRLAFFEKLAEYGWSPNQADMRYLVDETLIGLYDVREGFPRITPSTFEDGDIDDRISLRSYSLTLSGVDDYRVDFDAGMEAHEILTALLDSRD